MKKMIIFVMFLVASMLMMAGGITVVAQNKYELKAPNGISFSEIRGYETWQVIAPSYRTDNHEVRIILGNPVMINAYQEGIPGNGKLFPDGSTIVKIGWSDRKNPDFPAALEPDVLKRVEFIIKDSQRFRDSDGWGYARFVYDAKTSTFAPFGKDASFVQDCHQCHTAVKQKDFIFTGYPRR